ncbi:MAG: aspartate carbamoyltransferase [Gammaproteobacteria bacterium]
MKHIQFLSIGLFLFAVAAYAQEESSLKREEVQQRRELEVPYDVDKTLQTFTKTVHGGVQHVVVKSEGDMQQVRLIQDYLRQLVNEFRKGDFTGTERLHGAKMPGLIQLKKAETDDIFYEFQSLPNGAQIHYSSEYPQYVQALHEWFDAQMGEHGNAVVPEHMKHHESLAE